MGKKAEIGINWEGHHAVNSLLHAGTDGGGLLFVTFIG